MKKFSAHVVRVTETKRTYRIELLVFPASDGSLDSGMQFE